MWKRQADVGKKYIWEIIIFKAESINYVWTSGLVQEQSSVLHFFNSGYLKCCLYWNCIYISWSLFYFILFQLWFISSTLFPDPCILLKVNIRFFIELMQPVVSGFFSVFQSCGRFYFWSVSDKIIFWLLFIHVCFRVTHMWQNKFTDSWT